MAEQQTPGISPAVAYQEAAMPSSFPGMDPYLEGEMWQEFHERLAHQISVHLLAQLSPKYVALLAKRYVVGAPTSGILPGLGLNIVDWPQQRVI
jgi:hypothetical protein